ncbi:type II toxin-antitoxin system Phd/YefM family antitoxin [Prosthecomicrobium pneumaticum]|uniref:Antitoxin n=1 Tax=Prosthecomicrobium pneumaticum TaxID=81895 RepID=A0A7W9CW82_9HYPH|nr:type II toxin-antitoxin system prevent-host-death family antitoxin [Prosthecomicrobium pneumaticum]MBB5752748.1 prevent-host-death family protein [Prosthecomicrobium pneumaticum]
MVTIGAAEALSKLADLLDRVEAGEEVTITRDGKPIARLTPAPKEAPAEKAIEEMSPEEAFQELLKLREHMTLGGIDWRDLRDEGRR